MQKRTQIKVSKPENSPGPIGWAEMGLVPDRVIRAGIRRLNRQRLVDIHADDLELSSRELTSFVDEMNQSSPHCLNLPTNSTTRFRLIFLAS